MFAYIKKKLYLCNIEIKIITIGEPEAKTSPKGMGKEL